MSVSLFDDSVCVLGFSLFLIIWPVLLDYFFICLFACLLAFVRLLIYFVCLLVCLFVCSFVRSCFVFCDVAYLMCVCYVFV